MTEDGEDRTSEELSGSRSRAEAAARLLRLGQRLVRLKDDELASIPLEEPLREAVLEARRLPPHTEAMRRQLQFVAKRLRRVDVEPIERRVAAIETGEFAAGVHHQGEAWLARLHAEGDAGLQAFVEAFPGADRQHLRQLARKVDRAPEGPQRERASRELASALRDVIRGATGP